MSYSVCIYLFETIGVISQSVHVCYLTFILVWVMCEKNPTLFHKGMELGRVVQFCRNHRNIHLNSLCCSSIHGIIIILDHQNIGDDIISSVLSSSVHEICKIHNLGRR